MKESQAEIQAIQAKLRALQLGRSRQASIDPHPSSSQTTLSQAVSQDVTQVGLQQRLPASQQRQSLPANVSASVSDKMSAKVPAHAPVEVATVSQQRLKAQIDRVNQLAVAQEQALLELKTIADQIEHDRSRLRSSDATNFNQTPAVCEYLNAAVPQVEPDATGGYVVTLRAIDLFRAEREAALTAQSLRRRARHTSRTLSRRKRVTALVSPAVDRRGSVRESIRESAREPVYESDGRQPVDLMPSSRRVERSARRQAASTPPLSVADAAIWVIGAAVARMGLDLLLASVPHLWLPVVGMIAAPAAFAIYRTAFTPEAGFIWGYRLFLVMAGLLLGGRL
jgi:hypothetical protein